MKILALDLSKTRTGFAHWDGKSRKAMLGSWVLGSEYTPEGQVFAKLHRNLADLFVVMPFEALYFEQKINPARLAGYTNIDTLNLLSGLEAHAKSFAYAYSLRICKPVAIDHWRPFFLGRMPVADAKAAARRARKVGDQKASASKDLKALTMERARQLGFLPRYDDEADAIGVLDYACDLNGIVPPWRSEEVLQPPLGSAA